MPVRYYARYSGFKSHRSNEHKRVNSRVDCVKNLVKLKTIFQATPDMALCERYLAAPRNIHPSQNIPKNLRGEDSVAPIPPVEQRRKRKLPQIKEKQDALQKLVAERAKKAKKAPGTPNTTDNRYKIRTELGEPKYFAVFRYKLAKRMSLSNGSSGRRYRRNQKKICMFCTSERA